MPDQITVDPAHTMDVSAAAFDDCQPANERETATSWSWSSNDESVATVAPLTDPSQARISGVSEGTTTIRATLAPPGNPRTFSGTVTVTVNALGGLTITPPAASMMVGESVVLTAHPEDQNGSAVTVPVIWTSGNTGVVSVVAGAGTTAAVHALSEGTTEVTATVGSVSAQAPIAVAGEAQPAFITGIMRGGDGTTPLAGITVNISRAGTGIGSDITDENGEYLVDVTPGGTIGLFASGVCDPDHPCNHELSFNSTESEVIEVAPGDTEFYDPQAQNGYHLRITNGFQNLQAGTGDPVPLQLGYVVWNRANLPGGAPRIAAGIEGDAQGVHIVGVPGAYPPDPPGTGTANFTLTAPGNAGVYGVFVRLVTAAANVNALTVYEDAFPNGRIFIRVGTLTVN